MKKKRAIQQKDLAKVLNVSTMTISKALRDHPDISPDVRKRVKKLAKELGYRPNYIARNLSSRKSYTIGVVMPKIAHSFYSSLLDGIYKAAKKQGYEIIFTVSRESAKLEEENIQTLLAMQVDGILVSVSQKTKDPKIYETVKELGVPLVFLDRSFEGLGFSSVTVDDRGGAACAVEHAIKLGYTEIAHFAGFPNVDISRKRRAGYLDMLEKYNIPIKSEWIVECGFGEQAGLNAFRELFQGNNLPQVIFTVSDSVAVGVYKAIRETKLNMGRDVGVIGFTDIKVASILTPPLTTIHEPAEMIGKKAVECIVSEIEDGNAVRPQNIILGTELKVRESCGEKHISIARKKKSPKRVTSKITV